MKSRASKTSSQFFAIIQPLMAPVAHGDVQHFRTRLNPFISIFLHPRLAPVIFPVLTNTLFQIRHCRTHDSARNQRAMAFAKECFTLAYGQMFDHVFGVDVAATGVPKRQAVANIPNQDGGIVLTLPVLSVEMHPPVKSNSATPDMNVVRALEVA